MLCIVAGVDQKDRYGAGYVSLVAYYSRGMSLAGFAGVVLCFHLLSTGPRCLASWSVWTRRTVMQ